MSSPRVPKVPSRTTARRQLTDETAAARRDYERDPRHRTIEEDGVPAIAMAAHPAAHRWLVDHLEDLERQLQADEPARAWGRMPDWINRSLSSVHRVLGNALSETGGLMPTSLTMLGNACHQAQLDAPFEEYRLRLIIAHRIRRHLNDRTPVPFDWVESGITRLREVATDDNHRKAPTSELILWSLQIFAEVGAMQKSDRGRMPDLDLDWFAYFLLEWWEIEGRPAPLPAEAGDLWIALGGPGTRAEVRSKMKHRLARAKRQRAARQPRRV